MGARWESRVPPLGPRGEGWVVIQAVLFTIVIVAGLIGVRWPDAVRVLGRLAASLLGLGGLVLASSAAITLGESVSPFPKPPHSSELKESGTFSHARHPIYGGLLLLSTAWSLAFSPLALIPTVALALALAFKSRLEEQWLVERHPAYLGYRSRVRRRFIPMVW
jgi:protein-S-isoprenylcysteine O-methyltransferase Ste14